MRMEASQGLLSYNRGDDIDAQRAACCPVKLQAVQEEMEMEMEMEVEVEMDVLYLEQLGIAAWDCCRLMTFHDSFAWRPVYYTSCK